LLVDWAHRRGHEIKEQHHTLRIKGAHGLEWALHLNKCELRSFLNRTSRVASADLLIANAFLDIVDVSSVLPELLAALVPTGLYWFTINFDGDTIFEPSHPCDLKLMEVYHRSMDERVRFGAPAGDSKTGRHLFEQLRRAGASVLSAGSSDWVVFAENGRYKADEAHFVHHIIYTIDQELKQHPQIASDELEEWVSKRHAQVDRGELVYIAHQLDFCGRPGS
jgi:hypothetical protein